MSAITRLTRMELKLLTREPFILLFVFFFPIVVLLVLAGVFTTEGEAQWGGTTPSTYYLAGYIGTVIATLSLVSVPVHVASYRDRGILRRFTASSVRAHIVLLSQLIVGLILAAAGSIALVITASVIYEIESPINIASVLVTFIVGTLSFVTLGLMLGVLMPTARSAQAVGLILLFPQWMLSGTGPPPEVMTDAMRSISQVLPMTRLVNALQSSWFGDGTNYTELVILTGILIVAGSIAMYRIRAVE
jgi:ABC-2 type transport system permease protein